MQFSYLCCNEKTDCTKHLVHPFVIVKKIFLGGNIRKY